MYNRISIIGGSGSGKSTLATILSNKFGLPAIHLDSINFNSNWKEINKNTRDNIILEKSNEDKWIIDGNYLNTLPYRFDRADLIIWLDYSTFAQLQGILKRLYTLFSKEKPEVPGCKERLNLKFLKYVITYNKKKRPEILKLLNNVPKDKVLIFKSKKDLNKWLKEVLPNYI